MCYELVPPVCVQSPPTNWIISDFGAMTKRFTKM
ncbi:unnamed protein product [Brugia pahangi]|uniref:Uncharacterized protein n=1 Tax=Brugia pahangi TaxID=6280 RepID=A0A0N4TBX2_BRUPA|nr:unnamed protein product [Brugia pahangi]